MRAGAISFSKTPVKHKASCKVWRVAIGKQAKSLSPFTLWLIKLNVNPAPVLVRNLYAVLPPLSDRCSPATPHE